ncbi:putative Transmembrane protein [Melia azedarach]|uniref:Transmembrane protein n=1 Tax=Melia azedarach TaxID=155640 RepID=A0ACC1YRL0_MELAZ|nr:putative Transmembrane protein [Melia azedarach]
MARCKPCAFLLGLPFALLSLILSLIGGILWFFWGIVSCMCPCCVCCAGIANFAMFLIKLPVKITHWFIKQIPC